MGRPYIFEGEKDIPAPYTFYTFESVGAYLCVSNVWLAMGPMAEHSKGAIIFFWMGGGCMKKLGGHRIFSWEIGGHTKNLEIIGWLQILMKILFSGIMGVTYFFNIVAPGGGS